MSTSHGTGITWAELYGFLTTTAGCTEISWRPGTHITLRKPDGTTFGTCKPEKTGDVSKEHFAMVAREFGRSVSDMEIWMGRRPAGKSRLTAKRANRKIKTAAKTTTPAHVDELATRIRSEAQAIYRSGPCRMASHSQRAELERITRRLEQWHIATENGLAVNK